MPATAKSLTSAAERETSLHAVMVTNMFPTTAAPDDGTPVADELSALRGAGVQVELLHVLREGNSRRVYLGLARRVRRLVREADPDVVLVMYGGVMADIVTRSVHDVPVVVTFRGTDLLGGKGKGVVHGLSRRYGVVASRRSAGRAAGIVVKSPNLLHALPPSANRSRVWIVPDGVDLDRFAPGNKADCQASLGWDSRRRHLLFPGSPARPEKRFALAEAAVAALKQHGVDVELHALTGVPHDAVPTWLNAADAVVLTSAHEGSPNVVKEALACNARVVSVDVGDVRDWIGGIEGCRIVEPIAVDIAAQLAGVLSGSEVSAGRKRVQDLALPHVAATLREIYASVVREFRAERGQSER